MSATMVVPSQPHPTADLLRSAQAGDRRAFDHLFARLAPRLRWYVGMRLGSELRGIVEPDDVLQEAFAAGWSSLSSFESRGPGSLLRWFFVLAENRIKAISNRNRAQRRDRRRTLDGGPADAALALEADPRTGPCTRAARVELRMRLSQALDRLEPNERAVILGRVVEGRSFAEVAIELGRSESATRRLLAKAAARLGFLLEGSARS